MLSKVKEAGHGTIFPGAVKRRLEFSSACCTCHKIINFCEAELARYESPSHFPVPSIAMHKRMLTFNNSLHHGNESQG